MKLTILDLQEKIAAVAPIDSVSVGDSSDRSTWTVKFQDSATDAQKAAAQAVIDAAPVPLVMRHDTCSPFEFYKRFTTDELALLTASTDSKVVQWRESMQLYQEIILDGEEMETAMAYLVSLGLISETRKTEIMA